MVSILYFRNFGVVIATAILLSQITAPGAYSIETSFRDFQEREDPAVFTGSTIVEEDGSLLLQGIGVNIQFSEEVKIAVGNRLVTLSFVGTKRVHPIIFSF